MTDPKNTSPKDVAKRAAERIYRMYDHRGATEAVATIIREELVKPVESKEALFASYQAALKARYPTNELVFAVADEVADIWRKP